ncbi:hypothetical protein ILUMI_19075 [Ignelater luminosus]|uniref:Reverse transcriptase domain-containing protein n=1 Tax=Ignelater luminosus TaxID=2038154 RepID=A0A8K0G683_IGNLU|nr:hypothetical protein ILUMI_19075 [Ignelater luminosus]
MDNFDIIAAETQDEWDEHDGVPLTNLYAARRNRRTDITHQEVKYFLGILLLSGYCSVSRRRMYRKKTEDCHNKLVAEALRRDRFEHIMINFYCCELNKRRRFVLGLLIYKTGKPSNMENVNSRHDRLDHFITSQEKQTRCRHYHKKNAIQSNNDSKEKWDNRKGNNIIKESRRKFNAALLKNEEIRTKYNENAENVLTTNTQNMETEGRWENMKKAMLKANEVTASSTTRKRKKQWCNEECKYIAEKGDPMSTPFFNLLLEEIMRKTKIKTEETILKNEHQCVAFADDLTTMAKTKKKLQRIIGKIVKGTKRCELINEARTKCIIMGDRQHDIEESLNVQTEEQEYTFERVHKFTFLGVQIKENDWEDQEKETNITKEYQEYG